MPWSTSWRNTVSWQHYVAWEGQHNHWSCWCLVCHFIIQGLCLTKISPSLKQHVQDSPETSPTIPSHSSSVSTSCLSLQKKKRTVSHAVIPTSNLNPAPQSSTRGHNEHDSQEGDVLQGQHGGKSKTIVLGSGSLQSNKPLSQRNDCNSNGDDDGNSQLRKKGRHLSCGRVDQLNALHDKFLQKVEGHVQYWGLRSSILLQSMQLDTNIHKPLLSSAWNYWKRTYPKNLDEENGENLSLCRYFKCL